jgi:hypothetical protein
VKGPENITLPFFAYGIFRPGEISFLGIKDYVESVIPINVKGEIKYRDGLNFYVKNENKNVEGYLIYFHSSASELAYEFINSMEPQKFFEWKSHSGEGCSYNLLYGRDPKKGSVENQDEFERYTMWEDPFFTVAFEETLPHGIVVNNSNSIHDSMFKLQMKYMLLWTIIERFIFLRYSFGGKMGESRGEFSENLFVKAAIKEFGLDNQIKRDLYATNDPGDKVSYSIDNSKKAIQYYYQVRCNITHRGKGVHQDLKLLENCYSELFNIINYVLEQTKIECEQIKQEYESNMYF